MDSLAAALAGIAAVLGSRLAVAALGVEFAAAALDVERNRLAGDCLAVAVLDFDDCHADLKRNQRFEALHFPCSALYTDRNR